MGECRGRTEAAEVLVVVPVHKGRTEAAEVLVVVPVHKGRTEAADVLVVVLRHSSICHSSYVGCLSFVALWKEYQPSHQMVMHVLRHV